MADLQMANHNLDPAEVLLRTYDDYMQAGHNALQSYNHAKEMHPVEFQIVKDRARNHGHQNGVIGERHGSRYRLILRGHHTNPQNGVCVGYNHCATCVVLKYTTHNFLHNIPLHIQIRVGGSGGLIKRAFQQGERILQDQVLTMYNASLELSIATRLPVRLYAYLPRQVGQRRAVEYIYLGLWRVISRTILLTPLELHCYEFMLRFLAENQIPAIVQQLPLLGEVGVGGFEGFIQEGPGEDPIVENQEQWLLEWHVVEDANVEPLEVQEQHSPVIQYGRDVLSERKINSLAGRSDEERARQASNRAVMTESEVPDKENLPPPLTWQIHKRKRSRVVYLCVMTESENLPPPLTWEIHKRKRSRVVYL